MSCLTFKRDDISPKIMPRITILLLKNKFSASCPLFAIPVKVWIQVSIGPQYPILAVKANKWVSRVIQSIMLKQVFFLATK